MEFALDCKNHASYFKLLPFLFTLQNCLKRGAMFLHQVYVTFLNNIKILSFGAWILHYFFTMFIKLMSDLILQLRN